MTNQVRVNLIVEGQTEETFVRDTIAIHLAHKQVYLSHRLVKIGSGKGGLSNYATPRGDIKRWLAEDRQAYVTTMFDLYGLPRDFPGMGTLRDGMAPQEKVEIVERALSADINDERFVPYIQLHEFEALLFSDVDKLDQSIAALTQQRSQLDSLRGIIAQFPNPEDINDGQDTAPSKRLLSLYSAYRKNVVGPLVAEEIGIAVLRSKCAHFNNWLLSLERLAK
jgi:hypothetical protein